jgi:hypothetical protein
MPEDTAPAPAPTHADKPWTPETWCPETSGLTPERINSKMRDENAMLRAAIATAIPHLDTDKDLADEWIAKNCDYQRQQRRQALRTCQAALAVSTALHVERANNPKYSSVANLPQPINGDPDAWIDMLVEKLGHVRPDFVADVKGMPRQELQRRCLIGSDWQGSFACCLDGIKEIAVMPGGCIDGCRQPGDVRRVVLTLVEHCPITWEDCAHGRVKGVPIGRVDGYQVPQRLWIKFRADKTRGIEALWEFEPWPKESNAIMGDVVQYALMSSDEKPNQAPQTA